jgi:hypothetical protein
MVPWANRSGAEMASQDFTQNLEATWAAQLIRAGNRFPAKRHRIRIHPNRRNDPAVEVTSPQHPQNVHTSSSRFFCDSGPMKLWTLSMIAVAVYLTYSVTQYCRESTALHAKAIATERIPDAKQTRPARKPIDKAWLSRELAMRKRLAEEGHFSAQNVNLTDAMR